MRGEGHGQSVCRQVPKEAAAWARLPGRGGARDGRARGGTQQPARGQPACRLRDGPRHRPADGVVSRTDADKEGTPDISGELQEREVYMSSV